MSEPRQFRIAEGDDGRRIDLVLRRAAPRSLLMKWLRTGAVRRNGEKVSSPGERVRTGDAIEIAATPAPRRRLPPLDVVHRDDALLIVNKPPGLACHPGTLTGDDSLSARVEAFAFGSAGDRPGGGARPGLAQRLDRGVSGLVPIGLDAAALRALADAVESGRVRKVYFALVGGVVGPEEGVVDVPLRVTDEPLGDRPRTIPDPESGLPSITRFRTRRRLSDASLLEVEIETGRTHQIRAHLLAIGHPILGDPRYGDPLRNRRLRETFGIDRPMLHAARLELPHPRDGRPIAASAPPPADFERLLRALR